MLQRLGPVGEMDRQPRLGPDATKSAASHVWEEGEDTK